MDSGPQRHRLVKVCTCRHFYCSQALKILNIDMNWEILLIIIPWIYIHVHNHNFFHRTVVSTCGQLSSPVNGGLSLSSGVNEGSVATYTCDTGFNLTGSATRTCTSDGGWIPAAPVCLRISKSQYIKLYTVIKCTTYAYYEMNIYLYTYSWLWSPLLTPQWQCGHTLWYHSR